MNDGGRWAFFYFTLYLVNIGLGSMFRFSAPPAAGAPPRPPLPARRLRARSLAHARPPPRLRPAPPPVAYVVPNYEAAQTAPGPFIAIQVIFAGFLARRGGGGGGVAPVSPSLRRSLPPPFSFRPFVLSSVLPAPAQVSPKNMGTPVNGTPWLLFLYYCSVFGARRARFVCSGG